MLDQQPENTTKLATLKKVLLLEEFFSFFFSKVDNIMKCYQFL